MSPFSLLFSRCITSCLLVMSIHRIEVSSLAVRSSSSSSYSSIRSVVRMTDTLKNEDGSSSYSVPETKQRTSGPEMSEAIPFLARPKVLTKELAGDFGFDPLHLAKDRDTLWYYREIEIKHARLAMLAAAGWPTSEILDRPIAEYFNVPSALDDMDRVPFWGNGNLDQIRPEFWGFCLGLSAAIDSYQNQRSRTQKDYTPGDLGWDPLNLASSTTSRKSELQLAEMQNGRLAMLGVTGFAVQEFVVSQGVVDETPIFFQPLTETAENILKGILE